MHKIITLKFDTLNQFTSWTNTHHFADKVVSVFPWSGEVCAAYRVTKIDIEWLSANTAKTWY
jgi:hypothetical protein